MGYIKRSKYLHYHQKDDYARFSQREDLIRPRPAQYHSEMETYFFPEEYDFGRRDSAFTSRFKASGYVNGYGMGHFNRYSTSDAERGVGVHPKGVAPPNFYNPRDLGEEEVRSEFYEDSFRTRVGI